MNPSEEGFYLEKLISKAVEKLPVLSQNMREQQIKQYFKDNSLNGIDHWIKFGKNNVLIQDKWREDTTQQEVAQFLDCATRLNRRIPRDENIYLLWVSKYSPTKNSMASLNERGAEVIACSISVQALARLAILRIADCLGVDSVPALLAIPKDPSPLPVERASVIIDEEAMEILHIRRELNEKKRQEEEQQKAKIARVRELLLTEPALSWKMRVSPNTSEFHYWPQVSYAMGPSTFPVWNPSGSPSVDEMLKVYDEIQSFRSECIHHINTCIKKCMDALWDDTTDERIFQRERLQNSGSSGWDVPDFTAYLGTIHKRDGDADYWQTIILNEVGMPLFQEEFKKWRNYCDKFLERNRDKPRLNEALEKVDELQKRIGFLEKQNESLENKLTSIRQVIMS